MNALALGLSLAIGVLLGVAIVFLRSGKNPEITAADEEENQTVASRPRPERRLA
jgi:hypothetical protein